MKKTFKDLLQIDSVVAELYKQFPELPQTKFGYAYKKFYKKNYEPISKEFAEEIQDSHIDNALEDDKTKALILDEKSATGYAHTREQWKAIRKATKEITEKYENKEIEITPYISSYIPELTEEQKEILTGYII